MAPVTAVLALPSPHVPLTVWTSALQLIYRWQNQGGGGGGGNGPSTFCYHTRIIYLSGYRHNHNYIDIDLTKAAL